MKAYRRFFGLGGGLLLALLMLAGSLLLLGRAPVTALGTASELHVCPTGPPTCDYATVQEAMDAAADGDLIKVAAGTYTDMHARDGLTQVVYISKSLTIRGGYNWPDWDTFDPDAFHTVLDAQGQGRVFYITADDVTLEGLYITGGDAVGQPGWSGLGNNGGGICGAGADYLVVTRCWIYDNTANSGGGVNLHYCDDVEMTNNVVYDNLAIYGGGIRTSSSSVALRDNTLPEQRAQTQHLWRWWRGVGKI